MVRSAHGQLTFKGSHPLARRKAFESLGTQARRMVPAAHSRGPRREEGSGEPVDEAGTRGRRGGAKAPACSRSVPASERGAARRSTRASGAGSISARFPGRGMDVREGSRSDPKRVWGELPSGACESFAQSFGAKSAETAAPGEPARRGGHRNLERTERWPSLKKRR